MRKTLFILSVALIFGCNDARKFDQQAREAFGVRDKTGRGAVDSPTVLESFTTNTAAVQMAANTIPVGQGSNFTIDSLLPNMITLKTNAMSPGITPGSVLVSGEGDGFVRRVVNVNQTAPNTIEVLTQNGNLPDAFNQLDLSFVAENANLQNIVIAPLTIDLAGTELIDTNGIKGTITTGSIILEAKIVDVNLSIQNRRFDLSYDISIKSDLVVQFEVTDTIPLSGEIEIPGLSFKRSPAFLIPTGIPLFPFIPVTVSGKVFAGYDIEAKTIGTFSARLTQSDRITGGVHYTDANGFTTDPLTSNPTFAGQNPTLSVGQQLTAKIFLKPTIEVAIVGVVGATLEFVPSIDLTGESEIKNFGSLVTTSAAIKAEATLLANFKAEAASWIEDEPLFEIELFNKVFNIDRLVRRVIRGEFTPPQAGLQVTLTGASPSLTQTAMTDASGKYAFEGVEIGTYTLTPNPNNGTPFFPSQISVTITDEVDLNKNEDSEDNNFSPTNVTFNLTNGQTFTYGSPVSIIESVVLSKDVVDITVGTPPLAGSQAFFLRFEGTLSSLAPGTYPFDPSNLPTNGIATQFLSNGIPSSISNSTSSSGNISVGSITITSIDNVPGGLLTGSFSYTNLQFSNQNTAPTTIGDGSGTFNIVLP